MPCYKQSCFLKPLFQIFSLVSSKPDLLLQCSLQVCPDLDNYQADCGPLRLGLAGQHQRSNASLALQMSHTWLQKRCTPGTTLVACQSSNTCKQTKGLEAHNSYAVILLLFSLHQACRYMESNKNRFLLLLISKLGYPLFILMHCLSSLQK